MIRPSFASTIHALKLTVPSLGVAPTEEEIDVAEVLALIADHHQGSGDEPDAHGYWGRCRGCRNRWPCAAWLYGEELAVQFLGRAADRVWTHARAVMDEQRRQERKTA
ncbi:hypothetical protein ACFQE5_01615 [Pseudonocardia hispaniensis]|uniref:Uncharacterized protein n=1 Tax=Pseudonocardia hispaniensis TaxID=904933 RepID=A0ABW1IXD5_9PSEU